MTHPPPRVREACLSPRTSNETSSVVEARRPPAGSTGAGARSSGRRAPPAGRGRARRPGRRRSGPDPTRPPRRATGRRRSRAAIARPGRGRGPPRGRPGERPARQQRNAKGPEVVGADLIEPRAAIGVGSGLEPLDHDRRSLSGSGEHRRRRRGHPGHAGPGRQPFLDPLVGRAPARRRPASWTIRPNIGAVLAPPILEAYSSQKDREMQHLPTKSGGNNRI